MDIYGSFALLGLLGLLALLGRGCHTWLLWKKGEADAVGTKGP